MTKFTGHNLSWSGDSGVVLTEESIKTAKAFLNATQEFEIEFTLWSSTALVDLVGRIYTPIQDYIGQLIKNTCPN
jgi:hypothetical protein